MLEILILVGVLAGVGNRAHQRGLDKSTYVAIAATGWAVFFVLTLVALGPLGLFLRWSWVGGVWLFMESSHGGAKVSEQSWQCPDCRMYNDGGTLICLCGYKHENAPDEVAVDEKSPEVDEKTASEFD